MVRARRGQPSRSEYSSMTGLASSSPASSAIRERGLTARAAQLHLEPLALPDAEDLREAEALAGTGDRLTLRIMDFRLEHHVYDDPGHACLPCLRLRRYLARGLCRYRRTGHAAYATALRS